MNRIKNQYEKSWQDRIKKTPHEMFSEYERNAVLPPLFRRGETVLDLASGNAIVGAYLKHKLDCQVTALDFSVTAIADAKRRGVKGLVGSVEEPLPFAPHTFDSVFWGDNIEHVFSPKSILLEINRILKPGGSLILSTPNQAYWRYRLHTFLTGNLPKTEGDPNEPWEWEHIRFFTKPIIGRLLRLTGFKMNSFIGVSRRRPDKYVLKLMPELFGMIMVVEAKKK